LGTFAEQFVDYSQPVKIYKGTRMTTVKGFIKKSLVLNDDTRASVFHRCLLITAGIWFGKQLVISAQTLERLGFVALNISLLNILK